MTATNRTVSTLDGKKCQYTADLIREIDGKVYNGWGQVWLREKSKTKVLDQSSAELDIIRLLQSPSIALANCEDCYVLVGSGISADTGTRMPLCN